MKICMAFLLLTVALTQTPVARGAGFEAGVGGVSCRDVKRQIGRSWLDLKDFFRPNTEDLKRPKPGDYFCISPGYIRNAFPVRSGSMSLKCYVIEERNFCCDRELKACAGLR